MLQKQACSSFNKSLTLSLEENLTGAFHLILLFQFVVNNLNKLKKTLFLNYLNFFYKDFLFIFVYSMQLLKHFIKSMM